MTQRVRVRRDRPSAITWAFAIAVAMLFVYLATLAVPARVREDEPASARVTREIVLEPREAAFVSLGAYSDALNARVAAADFSLRGAAAYVYARSGSWHVLGAAYADLASARLQAEALSAREGLSASAFSLHAGGVTLRVTAPERTVNAIANADSALRTHLNQLGATADRLDRSEISASQARTLASVARSELAAAQKALKDAQENALCRALSEQLTDMIDELDAIRTADSAALSGRMRLCRVQGEISLIAILNSLTAVSSD